MVDQMKICFLSPYPPQPGGVAVHTSGLVKVLAKKEGNKIFVITYGRMGRKSGKNVRFVEIPVIRLKFLRGLSFFLGSVLMLFWLNLRHKLDIVHAEYMLPLGAAALFYRKIARRKPGVVVTAHGSDLLSLGENGVVGRFLSWIGNSCDKLVCVSKYLAKRAADIGVRHGKIEIIYNGIDDSGMPRGSREKIRKCLGLPEKKQVVTFVGSLSEAKGADTFVILAKHMLDWEPHGPGLHFVLVGGGPDRKELEHYCQKRGIADSVIFTGPKSHPESLKYIKSSDVLVVPSRVEGFGLTALEGMRLGVPVAASAAGALPEILSDLSVTDNLPKTVRDMLWSKRFRNRVVRENKRLSHKFGLKEMGNETEKLYQRVQRSA
jgi:glycosyltransferase involved in cell wall biosynthesis